MLEKVHGVSKEEAQKMATELESKKTESVSLFGRWLLKSCTTWCIVWGKGKCMEYINRCLNGISKSMCFLWASHQRKVRT